MSDGSRSRPGWPVVLGAWTLLGLARAGAVVLPAALPGPEEASPILQPLLGNLASAWLFALLTPVVSRICRAAPLRPGRLLGSTLLQLAGCLAVTACHEALTFPLLEALKPGPLTWDGLLVAARAQWLIHLSVSAGVYAGLVAVLHAVESVERARLADREAARLEAELAEAQLSEVKARLQPERFFAALSEIVAAIGSRPAEAEELLVDLADELRRSVSPASGTAPGPGDSSRSG